MVIGSVDPIWRNQANPFRHKSRIKFIRIVRFIAYKYGGDFIQRTGINSRINQ